MINKNISQTNKAITLIEILVTVAIFSLIAVAVSKFARDIYFYENIFTSGLTTYDEARKILQPISSEIRSASPSSLGAYPIEAANSNSFIFFTDLNDDGSKERVRYYLLNNNIMRGVTSPSGNPLQYLPSNETISTVVHGIVNGATPIFTYFDSSYNGSTEPLATPVSVLNVRLVKITLIIDDDPNRPPSPVTVSTQVNIRNLKDNL